MPRSFPGRKCSETSVILFHRADHHGPYLACAPTVTS